MDTPTTKPIARVERGLFAPGQSANPGGRRAYPDWFRGQLTDEALDYLAQVARGEAADPKITRLMACLEVINRSMGKPPIEVVAAGEGAPAALAELVDLVKKKKRAPSASS